MGWFQCLKHRLVPVLESLVVTHSCTCTESDNTPRIGSKDLGVVTKVLHVVHVMLVVSGWTTLLCFAAHHELYVMQGGVCVSFP